MDKVLLGSLALWHHPTSSPKGRALLVHGISEHSGRHKHTIDFFLKNHYEVVRFDLQGAGESGGRRQWVAHFDDYVSDTGKVHNWITRTLPELPLFLFGHSLGGAIAVHFAALYEKVLSGLLLSAPAYLPGGAFSPIKIAAAKMLDRIAPTLAVPNAGDGTGISRDPVEVKAYLEDPLNHHSNTVHQGNQILRALKVMPEKCSRIHLPVAIFHGTADKLVKPEGSFTLFQSFASQDRRLHFVPGGYHEMHNDICRDEYFGLVQQWLTEHQ